MIDRSSIMERIAIELERAYEKHGDKHWTRHEFFIVLSEEMDDLWEEIKDNSPEDVIVAEAIQVAAMVFRYIETGRRL